MSEHADQTDSTPAGVPSNEAEPSPLTFRITPIALLGVLAVTICATPLALSTPWLALLYVIPAGLTVWVARSRTVIDREHVVAQGMLRRTRFSWDDVRSFRLDANRWLRAVLHSGKEVRLPAVRVRDLSRLSRLSGGRLPDPRQAPEEKASDADASGEGTLDAGTSDAETGTTTTASSEDS